MLFFLERFWIKVVFFPLGAESGGKLFLIRLMYFASLRSRVFHVGDTARQEQCRFGADRSHHLIEHRGGEYDGQHHTGSFRRQHTLAQKGETDSHAGLGNQGKPHVIADGRAGFHDQAADIGSHIFAHNAD